MANPFYTLAPMTLEDRQNRALDYVECLDEQARDFARDMQNLRVTLIRLFNMEEKKASPEKTEDA